MADFKKSLKTLIILKSFGDAKALIIFSRSSYSPKNKAELSVQGFVRSLAMQLYLQTEKQNCYAKKAIPSIGLRNIRVSILERKMSLGSFVTLW